MNWDYAAKAAFALILNVAMFWLVVKHRVDPTLFTGLAMGELTGLGVYHAVGGASDSTPPTIPTEPTATPKA